jgi:hypothetical protein
MAKYSYGELRRSYAMRGAPLVKLRWRRRPASTGPHTTELPVSQVDQLHAYNAVFRFPG